MKSILLHNTDFTTEEFEQIGQSGLHVKTEKFYEEYGISKAIYYYTNRRVQTQTENPTTFRHLEAYNDSVNMLVKLHKLKSLQP